MTHARGLLRAGYSPAGSYGNAGVIPGLSRNCDQGATLHDATAFGLEGGGKR